MSTGRYILRGFASQGWRAAGRALADSGVTPQALTYGGGVVQEFRSRTAVSESRSRMTVSEFRSRTITMERGR